MVPYSMYDITAASQEYRIPDLGQLKSNYIIQHLKGDTIDTWLSWRLAHDDTLHITILDDGKYPKKVEAIKNMILSTESFEVDDSLYFVGWAGALEEASQISTAFYIPKNLEIADSTTGAGDITIKLVDYANGDGYSGFTKSIADKSQNQILKSEITIYDVDNLSLEQIASIARHEFGHAIGLAHSTDPADLMAPEMTTEYPYISECDIDATTSLYNDGQSSRVVCEK